MIKMRILYTDVTQFPPDQGHCSRLSRERGRPARDAARMAALPGLRSQAGIQRPWSEGKPTGIY